MELPFKTPVVHQDPNLPEFSTTSFFDLGLITPSGSNSSRRQELLQYAEQLISMGYVPIPLVGKRPILTSWERSTRDNAMAQLQSIPNFNNLGILTGESGGVTVVDIDNSHDKSGSDSFVRILNEAGLSYPNTLRVATGGGGTHLFFKYAGPQLLSAPLRRHGQRLSIDIKNNGGQVVAPGSIHPETGRLYVVENNSPPLEMPPSLRDVLLRYQQS